MSEDKLLWRVSALDFGEKIHEEMTQLNQESQQKEEEKRTQQEVAQHLTSALGVVGRDSGLTPTQQAFAGQYERVRRRQPLMTKRGYGGFKIPTGDRKP